MAKGKQYVALRAGFEHSPEMIQIRHSLNLTVQELWYALFQLASWFVEYGEYGKRKCGRTPVDEWTGVDGLEAALREYGMMVDVDGYVVLRRFCRICTREPVPREVREEMLKDAKCVKCDSTDRLSIDHIIPVCKGGSSKRSNLQVLCHECNSRKGGNYEEDGQ